MATSSETLPERDYEEDECVHDDDGRKEVDAFLIFVIFLHSHILRPGNFTLKSA